MGVCYTSAMEDDTIPEHGPAAPPADADHAAGHDQRADTVPRVPAQRGDRPATGRLENLGRGAWALVGIAVVAVAVYAALAWLSGFVIPLTVAVVVGTLLVPAVDFLGRWLPRAAAAALVMLALVSVAVGSLSIAVVGVIDQADRIRDQVTAGLVWLNDWLEKLGVSVPEAADLSSRLQSAAGDSISGLSAYMGAAFSGLGTFFVGLFVSAFILYYVLYDWDRLSTWVGSHIGVPADLGQGMLADATWSLRRYFFSLTVTSLITGVIIGLSALVVGLPLAFTIGLVTFVTSYVPYLGAIVSGAFAVLIALGAGGATQALIMLIVILATQNVVQPLMQNQMTASELNLHPVAAFVSTIVGAALAGVLGATLSAPALSMVIRIRRRILDYRPHTEAAPVGPGPIGAEPDPGRGLGG